MNKYLTAASFNGIGCHDDLIGSAHNELLALEINCLKPDK
jgi:hypothetical protein